MSLKEASKNISLFSKMFQPIIEAGPELDRIGNLEEYEKKLNGNIKALKLDEQATNDRITVAKKELDNKIAAHNNQVDADRTQIEDYRKASDLYKKGKEKEADEIVKSAKTSVQKINDDANNKAKQIVTDAENSIQDKQAELDAVNSQLASVNAAIKARETILDELNTKLGALQN